MTIKSGRQLAGIRMRTQAVVSVVAGALALSAAGTLEIRAVIAEDFRIENQVFQGAEQEPQIQSTTIFYQGVVYDYLEKPAEITVFDRAHHRFILLSTTRRLKTELTTDEIWDLNQQLRTWAASHADPFLKFLADPKFEESVDAGTGDLIFASPWLTYRVVLEDPRNTSIAEQYRYFSDWYTLLNTRLNPGTRPPFARLLVNEAMAKRHQLPKEVQLTFPAKKTTLPFQKKPITTIRSVHVLIRQLVQSDRDRVKETDDFLAVFQPIDVMQYLKKE